MNTPSFNGPWEIHRSGASSFSVMRKIGPNDHAYSVSIDGKYEVAASVSDQDTAEAVAKSLNDGTPPNGLHQDGTQLVRTSDGQPVGWAENLNAPGTAPEVALRIVKGREWEQVRENG
jgi:hypothetical protein